MNAKPIRVAFLLQDFTTGGISQWIYSICAELHRTDPGRFAFHFIATHGPVIREQFQKIGTAVFLGRLGKAPNWLGWRRVRKYVRDLSPDIVQFSNLVQYRDICFAVRPPVIIERKASTRTLDRYDSRGVDAIICQNRVVLDALKGQFDNISLVYHGVDIEALRRVVPNRLGFGSDAFVVGQASRIGCGQGHATLIDAVIRLRRRYPQVKMVLIGGTTPQPGAVDILPELRERARPLGDHARFTGHQDDPYPYIAGFDVATCTSTVALAEGAPRRLVEPMAMGIPCVTTDSGSTTEIVDDGETGLVVPGEDAEAMAAAIERLLTDRSLYEKLAANGRRKAEECFDVRTQARKVRDVYLGLLAKKTASAAAPA